MIDSNGYLKCDGCGKKLASELKGEVKIVCPRCKRFNVFSIELDKRIHKVVVSK